jgi:hypothetical protein
MRCDARAHAPARAHRLDELHQLRDRGDTASHETYLCSGEEYGNYIELVGGPRGDALASCGGGGGGGGQVRGCNFHVAHGLDVRVSFNYSSGTVGPPYNAALELRV